MLLQKDIALRQRLRMADDRADILDFRAGQRYQILADGQIAHVGHCDLRVGVQKIQHGADIPGAGIFKGEHAEPCIAVLHSVKHLGPGGKSRSAGKGKELAQGNMAPRALYALIGSCVLPQRGALVRAGNRHSFPQTCRVLVQHSGFPRGIKHRLAGLRLVTHHIGHGLHTLLKQSGHLGVDLVDLAACLL